MSDKRRFSAPLLVAATIDFASATAAPIADHFEPSTDVSLMCGASGAGIATFFGLCLYGISANQAAWEYLRDAIAGSFVVVYILTVAWSSFIGVYSGPDDGSKLLPISEAFVNNFTGLTGVVVGFYFTTDVISARKGV